jgi:hypothetical protein
LVGYNVRQPFAAAIASGLRDVHMMPTTWDRNYRGELAIVAPSGPAHGEHAHRLSWIQHDTEPPYRGLDDLWRRVARLHLTEAQRAAIQPHLCRFQAVVAYVVVADCHLVAIDARDDLWDRALFGDEYRQRLLREGYTHVAALELTDVCAMRTEVRTVGRPGPITLTAFQIQAIEADLAAAKRSRGPRGSYCQNDPLLECY